jgi:putative lipoprotein
MRSLAARSSILLAVMLMALCLPARARAADRWFGGDKVLHFSVSLGLAAGSYAGAALFFDASWQRASVSAAFTLSLGAGKELYDATGRGDASWRDFTWDVIGCAVGVGLAYVLDVLLKDTSARARPAAVPAL